MNAYDSSIGRQAGGTIQMTLKSGTAKLHGSLYEFNQNNVLNANTVPEQPGRRSTKPPIHLQRIRRRPSADRCGSPKSTTASRRPSSSSTTTAPATQDPRFSIRSLPTDLERKGDFSQSYTTQVTNGVRTGVPDSGLRSADRQGDANGARTLFPGNVIPSNRMSKVAQNILSYVPLPNTPSDGTSNASQQLRSVSSRQNKMADITVRGDHVWNNNHKSFATRPLVSRRRTERRRFPQRLHRRLSAPHDARLGHRPRVDASARTRSSTCKMNLTRYEEPNNDHGVGFDPATPRLPGIVHVASMFVPAAPAHHGPLRRHRHQPGRQRRRHGLLHVAGAS